MECGRNALSRAWSYSPPDLRRGMPMWGYPLSPTMPEDGCRGCRPGVVIESSEDERVWEVGRGGGRGCMAEWTEADKGIPGG